MTDLIDVHQNNGILVTTSRNVAEVFGKLHKNVLSDIEAALASIENISKTETAYISQSSNLSSGLNKPFFETNSLFIKSEYKPDPNGRSYPEYLITKDGLTLLVMGYTGETAMRFKLAYIQRFNEMEAELKERAKAADSITLKNLLEHMKLVSQALSETNLTGNQKAKLLNELAKKTIGIDYFDLIGVNLEEPLDEVLLSPTEIGEIVGISNQTVNRILKDLGYQNKEENSKFWLPTEKGLKNGAHIVNVYRRASAGSINQLKWSPKVINVIKGLLK